MYKLTLSKMERNAIDWVGHRDWNGDDFFRLLLDCPVMGIEEWEWSEDFDLTFLIPEHHAWSICSWVNELGIPHFSPALSRKLYLFVNEVI